MAARLVFIRFKWLYASMVRMCVTNRVWPHTLRHTFSKCRLFMRAIRRHCDTIVERQELLYKIKAVLGQEPLYNSVVPERDE